MAHELAHNLGADHDGAGDNRWVNMLRQTTGDTPDNKVGASDNSWVNRVHQTIGGTPAGTSDNRGIPQTTGGYIRQPVDQQVHQTTEDTPDNRWVHQATGG